MKISKQNWLIRWCVKFDVEFKQTLQRNAPITTCMIVRSAFASIFAMLLVALSVAGCVFGLIRAAAWVAAGAYLDALDEAAGIGLIVWIATLVFSYLLLDTFYGLNKKIRSFFPKSVDKSNINKVKWFSVFVQTIVNKVCIKVDIVD